VERLRNSTDYKSGLSVVYKVGRYNSQKDESHVVANKRAAVPRRRFRERAEGRGGDNLLIFL
jgi:hypothetical protein